MKLTAIYLHFSFLPVLVKQVENKSLFYFFRKLNCYSLILKPLHWPILVIYFYLLYQHA